MLSSVSRLSFLALLLLDSATAAPSFKGSHLDVSASSKILPRAGKNGAIYFITNEKENAVVSMKIKDDGTLADPALTKTGGAGAVGIEGDTGLPAAADGLFSQGAVAVSGQLLAAVNPGSNTLSLFKIDPANPTQPKMIGSAKNTLGEFPVSVALSTKHSLACVLNGGAKAGIACFRTCGKNGLTPLDSTLRAVQLQQKTPPVGPTGTASQVFFNSDKTALIATIKGDPPSGKAGSVAVFPVMNGTVSMNAVNSDPTGTKVLFGVAQIPGGNTFLATDAAFGAALIKVDATGQASTLNTTTIDGQKATCWATYSPASKSVFVTDVGNNNLVELDPQNAAIVSRLNFTNSNKGMIDLSHRGNFIYALSPGSNTTATNVMVVDVSGGKGKARQVQVANAGTASTVVQGMAVF